MSGFNTKERNNNGEYEITFYTDNHEDFKKVQDLCRNLIGHGKPVSTEGDLISREALKKEFDKECQCDCSVCEHSRFDSFKGYYHCGLIDNAPTVEAYTTEDMQKEYRRGITDAYKDNPPI